MIKKTNLDEYTYTLAMGKKAIKIREDDELLQVSLTDGNSEIILADREGRAIRFHESKVRAAGRDTMGVIGMTLGDNGDEVVGMITMKADSNDSIMVVSQNGFGKRSDLEDYRITNRGGKGVKTLNVTDKTGELVAIKNVTDDNDLVIINQSGITLRLAVKDVRIQGRATQGVKLIDLSKRGDTIASVCKVDSDPEEEEMPEGAADADDNNGNEIVITAETEVTDINPQEDTAPADSAASDAETSDNE